MSELQDAVALVELMGRFFVTSAKAGLWLGKGTINLAAALIAYEKTHQMEEGEIRYSKYLKNYGQEVTFLKFPEGIDKAARKDICKQLKKGGVPFSWAPVFKEGEDEPLLCVRQGDIRKVSLLLENYEKEQLDVGQWLDQQDGRLIGKRADQLFNTGTFEEVREICLSCAGTLSDQLNHYTDTLRPHEEEYITMDLNHPQNYIAVTSKRSIDEKNGQEYTKSTYMVYRDGTLVNTLTDGRGMGKSWGQTKKSIMQEIGITSDYAQMVTFKQQARSRLEQYQKLFEQHKVLPEQQMPEETVHQETEQPVEIVMDQESIREAGPYDLMRTVKLNEKTYIKVPISCFQDESDDHEVTIRLSKAAVTTYDEKGKATGSISVAEVKKRLEERVRKRKADKELAASVERKGRMQS